MIISTLLSVWRMERYDEQKLKILICLSNGSETRFTGFRGDAMSNEELGAWLDEQVASGQMDADDAQQLYGDTLWDETYQTIRYQ